MNIEALSNILVEEEQKLTELRKAELPEAQLERLQ